MKNKIFLGCLLAFSLCATSCSDFLDEDPKGKLSADNFFTSQNDLDMAVTALMRKVNDVSNNTNPWGASWMGDDLTTHPASNKQAYAQFDRFVPVDDNKTVVAKWNSDYAVIKAANYLIMNVDNTPVSDEEKKIALGQAHFWRAYWYFDLVRTFGPLPINTDNTISQETPLSSVKEVYDLIVSDLQYCVANLPTSYSKAPRVYNGANAYITKQAAMSTLACVYLNMAGWPLKDTSKYSDAASMAKQVIDGCNAGTYEYVLCPEYKTVYSLSDNYNNETIVGVNKNRAFTWSQDNETGFSNIFESQGGWGDGWGTYSFWKEFPEGARKDATFMPKIMVLVGGFKGQLHNFWDTDAEGNHIISEAHPAYQIFCASGNGTADFDYTYAANVKIDHACTQQRVRHMRYSELLLWYAEASTRATGSINAQALDCMNQVRVRAGEDPISESDYSAAEFADLCVKEHGWEVAGNWMACQTRRFDEQRMELFAQAWAQRQKDNTEGVEVAPGVILKETLAPSGSFSESAIYAPYPSTDVSLNPGLKR